MRFFGSPSRKKRPRLPVDRWLARQRRGVWLRGGLVAAVAIGVLMARGMGPAADYAQWNRRPLEVVEILDDRTLRVQRDDGKSVAIRLLGVTVEEPWSERCQRWLREATDNGTITLSFDAGRRSGEAKHLSAYVYLDDGRLVNEWMIGQGLARADSTAPHELDEWFTRLEGQARARRRGMWGESDEPPFPD